MVELIYFYAPWCNPCKAFGPGLEREMKKLKDEEGFKFTKVNVDTDPVLAERYNVSGVPTLLYLKMDRPAHKSSGAQPIHTVIGKINELLNKE